MVILALLLQQLGLNILPSNYSEIVNTVLTILAMVRLSVDPYLLYAIISKLIQQILYKPRDSEENKTIE